jgi:hypothetical protein
MVLGLSRRSMVVSRWLLGQVAVRLPVPTGISVPFSGFNSTKGEKRNFRKKRIFDLAIFFAMVVA